MKEDLVKNLKKRVIVLIDAANLEKSLEDVKSPMPKKFYKGMVWKNEGVKYNVDYEKLYNLFSKNCKLVDITFYTANFGTVSYNGFLTKLKSFGYKLVTKDIKYIQERKPFIYKSCKFCHTKNKLDTSFKCEKCGKLNDIPVRKKADVDVEIAVDATSRIAEYDTFVLFSGDSDYRYLLEHLRDVGKRTVVIFRRGHISDELTSVDTDFSIDVFKLRDEFLIKRTL